jgi:hypothetical protein
MANNGHPFPKAEDFPDTYEGHVSWHVNWLRAERDSGSEMIAYGDPEVTQIVANNFEECARIMEGQLQAIQIVQTMMEEMYAASPSPRMKALKAAIEAIYTA